MDLTVNSNFSGLIDLRKNEDISTNKEMKRWVFSKIIKSYKFIINLSDLILVRVLYSSILYIGIFSRKVTNILEIYSINKGYKKINPFNQNYISEKNIAFMAAMISEDEKNLTIEKIQELFEKKGMNLSFHHANKINKLIKNKNLLGKYFYSEEIQSLENTKKELVQINEENTELMIHLENISEEIENKENNKRVLEKLISELKIKSDELKEKINEDEQYYFELVQDIEKENNN